jgi:hypothetical protein
MINVLFLSILARARASLLMHIRQPKDLRANENSVIYEIS